MTEKDDQRAALGLLRAPMALLETDPAQTTSSVSRVAGAETAWDSCVIMRRRLNGQLESVVGRNETSLPCTDYNYHAKCPSSVTRQGTSIHLWVNILARVYWLNNSSTSVYVLPCQMWSLLVKRSDHWQRSKVCPSLGLSWAVDAQSQ